MSVSSFQEPRHGAMGAWDRIVGPGMPADETRLVLLASLVGAGLAAWRFENVMGMGWSVLLAALIGFDVLGGAVCNATQTTKKWYARKHSAFKNKIAFVLPHLGYIALIAWLWRGVSTFDAQYFAIFSTSLLTASIVVLIVPSRLAGPTSFGVFIAALTSILIWAGLTPGLEWFAPGLLLKLLIGHLVPPAETG